MEFTEKGRGVRPTLKKMYFKTNGRPSKSIFFAMLSFSMYYYTIRTTLASQTVRNTPDGGPCNVLQYSW